MSLEKLSIFSKDTDATEALRGYEYQKLRTLDNWLDIYLDGSDQIIYCDYEEDIFQRDVSAWVSKFRQLKLYSSKNFSFSSVEIIKAISHFFTLFAKGDYKFDDVQFIFETNAAVARSYGDNDAALLQRWKDNQANLPVDLLEACVNKVKAMVEEYAEQVIKGVKKDEILVAEMNRAKLILKDIPWATWGTFVKAIRWEFSDKSAEEAIETVVQNINNQIIKTGFPAAIEQKANAFARLYYTVAEKSIQTNPDDRKLDSALLDSLLLDTGDNEDKHYNVDFKKWADVKQIEHFRPSEFYEIINLSYYSRYHNYLKHHGETWTGLLKQYITLEETPERNKQKAIYELLWNSLGVKMLEEPTGTLKGLEDYARTYFSNTEEFNDHESLEDAVALLGVITGAMFFGKANFTASQVESWRKLNLDKTLAALNVAKDDNEACYLHAIAAQLLLQDISRPEKDKALSDALAHFEHILNKLKTAPLYDVRELGNRINAFISVLINLEHNVEEIERLEEFSEKLTPFIAAKSSDNDMAKNYINRGSKYLQSKEPKSILRALNYFHKAKTLWRNDGTREGYILGLLNVSQLYSGMGCNLAAKYYALSAARHASEHEEQHKRISDAFALILHADFKQGAWISAIEDYRFYAISHAEYKTSELSEADEMFLKCGVEISFILALASGISPQLGGLIAYEKIKMGGLYTGFLEHQVNYIDDNATDEQLHNIISGKLDDYPLNDLSAERVINWKALGNIWKIRFANNWIGNSVGEEFVAMLQILSTELGLSKLDLHLLKTSIDITIEVGDDWEPPVRQPSNTLHKWHIKMPAIMDEDYAKIKMQPAYVLVSLKTILDEISLLPTDELFNEIQRMFEKEDLASKTLPDFLYQRTYRFLSSEKIFNEYRREDFQEVGYQVDILEDRALSWYSEISGKYSLELSLELIDGRYENAYKGIYLTLAEIKKDSRYPQFIKDLRGKGWLDWQIEMAMLNHICSYKLNRTIDGKTFDSDEEKEQILKSTYDKIVKADEKENFVLFPLDYFIGEDFDFQLSQVALLTLGRWGLENKAKFPNFEAIKEFLIVRFNFGKDDKCDISQL
ncbi:MAG: hypothetical protein V4619_08185 [Bacteroidota bacterium]